MAKRKRHTKQYLDYLESPEWYAKRAEVLKRDNHRCTECDAQINLHVHHKTYKRLGNENLDDLITLCYICHMKLHDKPEPKSKIPKKARYTKKKDRAVNGFHTNDLERRRKQRAAQHGWDKQPVEYIEIAKGVLVRKGTSPTKEQQIKANKIKNKEERERKRNRINRARRIKKS